MSVITDIQHRKKQRKLYSCTICRIRKKKCDRVRPICSTCKLGGLKCSFIQANGSTSNRSSPSEISPSSSSSGDISDITNEAVLRTQLEMLQRRLQDIEYENISNKSKANAIEVSPNELIDIYYNCSSPFHCSTNSILMVENFHNLFVFLSDKYIYFLFSKIHSIHRKAKEQLKLALLDDLITLSTEKYPKEVYDNIKLRSSICIIENTYNKKNRNYQYYVNLACSFYLAKAKAISFSISSAASAAGTSLITKIESMLPRIDIINYFFNIFEKYIHPFVPILNLKVFREDIVTSITGLRFVDEKLKPDYNILVTTYMDLVNIGILFMVLRLAYLAIKIDIEMIGPTSDLEREIFSSNKFEFIGPEFVNVSIECSNKSKVFKKNTFNSLALRTLHVYYLRVCEERDFRSAITLVPVLTAEATVLGLFRDWTKIESLEVTRSYAGMGLYTHDHLIAYQQRVYPLLKSIICETRFNLGSSFECNFLDYELPQSDFSDLVKDNDKSNNHFLNFLRFKFDLLKSSNKLLLEITEFFRSGNTSNLKGVRDLLTLRMKLELLIEEKYTDFPSKYFMNDENFVTGENFDNTETKCYYMILYKITKFQDCLNLFLVQLKLLFILWTHYERSFFKTSSVELRHKYLKNWIQILKILQKSSFAVVYLIGHQYLFKHKEFFKLNEYPQFKNFGTNTNISGFIVQSSSFFFYSICFRIFNTLHLISTLKQSSSINVKDILILNNKLIKLKDLTVLMLEYISYVFHQKCSPFYTTTGKLFIIFKDLVSSMKANNPLNNDKIIPDIFSFIGYGTSHNDKSTFEDDFDVCEKGSCSQPDEMFLHLNDYPDSDLCINDCTSYDSISAKYKELDPTFNISEWLKYHTLLMEKDDNYNIIDVSVSFNKLIKMLKPNSSS